MYFVNSNLCKARIVQESKSVLYRASQQFLEGTLNPIMQNITELFVTSKALSSHESKVFVLLLMYQEHYRMQDSVITSCDCRALTQISSEAREEIHLPKNIQQSILSLRYLIKNKS